MNSSADIANYLSLAPPTIRIMTFNIGCLPGAGAINARFLRPNNERTQLIIERILKWNMRADAPDILCFQEAMAPITRAQLQYKLSDNKNSPYPYNTETLGQRLRGSGLLIFSKYPILEGKFIHFNNAKLGDESLAIKGYLGVKLKITDKLFITVFTTHLEAGGAILPKQQTKLSGKTNSDERGEQMGAILTAIERWGINPPENYPNMNHFKTFVNGDFNCPLNDERRMLGISTGNANNGFKKKMEKYPGQLKLFEHLEHTVPENFMDVLDEKNYLNGKKQIDKALLAKAEKLNKFVGTCIPNATCKNNKDAKIPTPIMPYQTHPKIIDGMFVSHFNKQQQLDWGIYDASGAFFSKIVSFKLDGEGGESDIGISDHFPVLGVFTPRLK